MKNNSLKKILNYTLQHKKILYILSYLYFLVNKNKSKIKGKNNYVKHSGAFLSNVIIDMEGSNNQIVIEENVKLSNVKIFIRGCQHKLYIKDSSVIKKGEFWFEDRECKIKVGSNTTIEEAHIAVTEPFSKIEIGDDCMLSFGIDIRSGDSHSIIDITTQRRLNLAKNVSIDDHVWIGAKVSILKGSHIESNSVVGIGSIVTSRIPPNSIAVGAPAKVIKENINWLRERT